MGRHYQEHLSREDIHSLIESGKAFRGVFRVNASDRREAYVTIPGILFDILIKGAALQNRAVEGDEVAIRVLDPACWHRHHSRNSFTSRGSQERCASRTSSFGAQPASQPLLVPTTTSLPSDASGGDLQWSCPVSCVDGSPVRDTYPSSMCAVNTSSCVHQTGSFHSTISSGSSGSTSLVGSTGYRTAQGSFHSMLSSEGSGTLAALGTRSRVSLSESDANGEAMMDADAGYGGHSVSPPDVNARLADLDAMFGMLELPPSGDGTGNSDGTGRTTIQHGRPPVADTTTRRSCNNDATNNLSHSGSSNGRSTTSGTPGTRHMEQYTASRPGGSWYTSDSPADALLALNNRLPSDGTVRPTGEVLGVLRSSPKRDALVGVLTYEGNGKLLFLVPSDARLPRCVVSFSSLPPEHKKSLKCEAAQPMLLARTLVMARMLKWDSRSTCACALVTEVLGPGGDIQAETAALVRTAGVSIDAFPEEVLAAASTVPRTIGEGDVGGRKDLRGRLLFTIDPPTATDLDDAVSWEDLGGGGARVGVHIADVSYFVRPNTSVDAEARSRGTTVYLVQQRASMLPSQIEAMCSLNPGEDKLAVSIMWDLDADGSCVSQWIGRSVIRSCAKLSYPQVQEMLDSTFDQTRQSTQLHGGRTWDQVVEAVRRLWDVAEKLRAQRAERGAMRLDNPKLSFVYGDDGLPCEVAPDRHTPANQLIEQLMLQANTSVAREISSAFPDRCLLRRHPPPNHLKLKEVAEQLAALGWHVDPSSSLSLQQSLAAIRTACDQQEIMDTIQLLLTKPMQNAQYFCGCTFPDDGEWRHFALAEPCYTHFTSPIRRYPDVMVHRMVLALCGADTASNQDDGMVPDGDEVQRVTEHCNKTKLAARAAQDGSTQLHLCNMLYRTPVISTAIVTSVKGPKFFEVYVPYCACDVRLHVANILPAGLAAEWNEGDRTLTLSAPSSSSNALSTVPSLDCPDAPAVFQGINNAPLTRNEHNLQPVGLPLSLQLFSKIPVILSAQRSALSGSFTDVLVRPYIVHAAP